MAYSRRSGLDRLASRVGCVPAWDETGEAHAGLADPFPAVAGSPLPARPAGFVFLFAARSSASPSSGRELPSASARAEHVFGFSVFRTETSSRGDHP